MSPVDLNSPFRVRLSWYALTFALALLFPIVGYRLDCSSLDAPLSYETDRLMYNDAFLILPMVQSTLESGTHWKTERLGFPGVQTLYDFPVIDHFHFLWLWILGQITGSTILAFNIYYLLTYPLAALSMLAVTRRFGASFPASVVAGLLFACLPYHQYRSTNHYFLSAYYMVPLTCDVILRVGLGQLPFFWRRRYTVFAVVVMLITACAGAYYAFFACALLAAAGLYSAIGHRSWRPLASTALLVGITVVAGFANHLPQFLYQSREGKHSTPVARMPEESEFYGLKITQLVMPIDEHKIRRFAEYKSIYNSYLRPVQAYTERYSLGTVTALGFLGLMLCLLLPVGRRQPVAVLAAVTGFAVAIGTVGGLGAIFNQTITPSVRCYNRIAIYIAVFSLIALGLAGDCVAVWFKAKAPRRIKSCTPLAFWIGLLWFGLWDMTSYDWGTDTRVVEIHTNQSHWYQDEAFFKRVEDVLNPDGVTPGPAIFQLPYVAWPESAATHQLATYDHVRGYLHTKTLRWSFGCIKGRETDDWYRSVAVLPPNASDRMLDRLALAGFEGLLLDKRGYSPKVAKAIEDSIAQKLPGATVIRHPDGQQVFYDLRRFRDDVRPGRNWDRETYLETHRVSLLWLDGFVSFAEPGYEWKRRLCGPRGETILVNPGTEPRTITLAMKLSTDYLTPSPLSISGGELWSETVMIASVPTILRRTITVPPGRHAIRFDCKLPESHMPSESRRLTFAIEDFRLEQ